MHSQKNKMKCKFLVDDITPSCIAGEFSYVQTSFQVEEYCKKAEHRKCPFYISRMTKEHAEAAIGVR